MPRAPVLGTHSGLGALSHLAYPANLEIWQHALGTFRARLGCSLGFYIPRIHWSQVCEVPRAPVLGAQSGLGALSHLAYPANLEI